MGEMKLTIPMRDLLWAVAQHKHGWTYVERQRGQLQVADALARRGLVRFSEMVGKRRQDESPVIWANDGGRAEIERRWPISPFALRTYKRQPGGWDSPEGRASLKGGDCLDG